MSLMRRREQARAERGRAGIRGAAQSTSFPLPVKGLFAEARNAEIRGVYAAVMENWRSNGVAMETRPQSEVIFTPNNADITRFPVELNDEEFYIETFQDVAGFLRVKAGDLETSGQIGSRYDIGYISNHALIAHNAGQPYRYKKGVLDRAPFTIDGEEPSPPLDGLVAHHDRIYFWRRGRSLDFWYGDVGAVEGPLTKFPLSQLGSITGTIADMLSLTVDAGNGLNDMLCIITTTGMIVVYEGLNPGDATDWRLVSRVKVAPPVGADAFAQVGSDVWMISTSGIVSVTDAIRRGVLALIGEISRPVADDILQQVQLGGDWQLHTAADGSMVILNHVLEGVAKQWIYYVDSQSWATANLQARKWHNLGLHTEFTNFKFGRLQRLDRAAYGPETMTAIFHSSWFRLPTARGLATITPTILAKAPLEVKVAVLTDHDTTPADLDEAWQTVELQPDNAGDGQEIISLDEVIAMDAVGSVFQIRMEVTARWAELVNLEVSLK